MLTKRFGSSVERGGRLIIVVRTTLRVVGWVGVGIGIARMVRVGVY